MQKPSFVKRNLVAIVMIPSLVLLHIGWQKLQYVEELVPEHERKDEFPTFAAPAKILGYLTGRYKPEK